MKLLIGGGARVLLVPVLGISLAVGATAQTRPTAGVSLMPRPETMKALALTTEQQTKLRDLGEESRARTKQLGEAMRKVRLDLEQTYSQFRLDTRRAKQLNDQINEIQKDMLEEHLRVEQKLRAILTADQFTRLRAESAQRWKNRFPRTRPYGQERPKP